MQSMVLVTQLLGPRTYGTSISIPIFQLKKLKLKKTVNKFAALTARNPRIKCIPVEGNVFSDTLLLTEQGTQWPRLHSKAMITLRTFTFLNPSSFSLNLPPKTEFFCSKMK